MFKKAFWIFFCVSFLGISTLAALPLELNSPIWQTDQKIDPFNFRPRLGEYGIYLLPSYIQDLDWPTRGGFKTTDYPLYLFLFSLELGIDFDKLCGLEGFLGYLDFLVFNGRQPTAQFVKDYQGFDNIEAYPLVQLAELWAQKNFFNNKLELRVGKIDCYGVFMFTTYAQVLINNSYSQIPTVLGYPSYPTSSVGIIVNYKPKPWLILRSSIFDGSDAQGVRTGNLGAKRFFQNLGRHLLLLNEVDFKWSKQIYPGELQLGLWGFNGRLNCFDGSTMGKAAGPYISLSQTLWREKSKPNCPNAKSSRFGGFAQNSYVNQNISGAKFYLSGGLTYENLMKRFHYDAISIGAATVYFSQANGAPFVDTFETSLEATYQINFYEGIMLQPDIQWIIHPGGQGRKNALVTALRISIAI